MKQAPWFAMWKHLAKRARRRSATWSLGPQRTICSAPHSPSIVPFCRESEGAREGLQSVGMLNVSLQGFERLLVRLPLAHCQEYHRAYLCNGWIFPSLLFSYAYSTELPSTASLVRKIVNTLESVEEKARAYGDTKERYVISHAAMYTVSFYYLTKALWQCSLVSGTAYRS